MATQHDEAPSASYPEGGTRFVNKALPGLYFRLYPASVPAPVDMLVMVMLPNAVRWAPARMTIEGWRAPNGTPLKDAPTQWILTEKHRRD